MKANMRKSNPKFGVPGFRQLDDALPAVPFCEVCHKPFPSQADMRQHLCLDPKRELKVQLWRLTEEQVLAYKSPSVGKSQQKSSSHRCPICKLDFKDSLPFNLHMVLHKKMPNEPQKRIESNSSVDASTNKVLKDTVGYRTREAAPVNARSILRSNLALKSQVGNLTTFESLSTQIALQCNHPGCNSVFLSISQLELHMQMHEGASIFACQKCGECFPSRAVLKDHEKTHRNPDISNKNIDQSEAYKCNYPDCGQSFSTTADRRAHVLKHLPNTATPETIDDDLLHKCEHCGELVRTMWLFQKHVSQHEYKFSGCLSCLYANCKHFYKNSSDLKKHVAKHREEASRQDPMCTKCNRYFLSSDILQEHMAVHENGKAPEHEVHEVDPLAVDPNACDECDEVLPSSSSLKQHLRQHNRWFACDVPGCSFAGKIYEDLKEHQQNCHVKEFECHLCGYVIRHSMYQLKKHVRRHFSETPGFFKCLAMVGCTWKFKHAKDLRAHTIDYCLKRLDPSTTVLPQPDVGNLSTQRRLIGDDPSRNAYICDLCGLQFEDKSKLRLHTKKHSKDVAITGKERNLDTTLNGYIPILRYEIKEIVFN